MCSNGELAKPNQLADVFANYFIVKVDDIVNKLEIDESVYNGRQKIAPVYLRFMSFECMNSLKTKNAEGFNRIPQRISKDGCNHVA
jgi:hypothetical protein